MNKTELIEIVNAVVEVRIKKLLPKLVKDEIEKMKDNILDDVNKYVQKEIHAWLKSVKSQTKLQTEVSHVLEEDDSPIDMADLLTDADTDLNIQEEAETGPQKIFSKNPAINDIMNGMIRNKKKSSDSSAESMTEYRKLLSEEYANGMETFSFDSRNIGAIANRTAMVPQTPTGTVPKAIGQEILKKEIEAIGGKPEIVNAMVKDYRAVLKKMDEKAQQIRNANGK